MALGLPEDLPGEYLQGLSVDNQERTWTTWLASEASAGGTLVARRDARIVGFCSFGPSRDDDAAKGTAEVLTIYLLEDSVGRGIGRELFGAAKKTLRDLGYRRATLWVLASNARTRRFYEKAGWTWDDTTSEHRFDCANLPIVRYTTDL